MNVLNECSFHAAWAADAVKGEVIMCGQHRVTA